MHKHLIAGILMFIITASITPGLASAQEDCMSQPDHTRTVQCLKKEGVVLNHELQQSYEALLHNLKQAEQTLPQRYRSKLVNRFKSAYKSWEKYRDTQCEYERMHALGGIEEPIVLQQCRNTITHDQVQMLQRQIKQWTYN